MGTKLNGSSAFKYLGIGRKVPLWSYVDKKNLRHF